MPGNLRLLDAIRMANAGALPSPSQSNFRRVEVRNGDSLRTFDLLRYLSRNDIDENPYVYPGDNIRLRPTDARVFVTGEVMEPVKGGIPLREGETVGDVLDVVHFRSTADSGSILLRKAGEGEGAASGPLPLAEASGLPLGPNDVIVVGAKGRLRRPDTVQVTGEVVRPGTYVIEPGQTTLADLLAQAGGPTGLGDDGRAFILRSRKKREVMVPFGRKDGNDAGIPSPLRTTASLQMVRPEVASSVSDLQLSGDFTVLDGPRAAGKGVLQDGDELHLPRRDPFVYVSGNVHKPGAYPYKDGAGAEYYIDLAQGYTSKADSKNMFVLAVYKEAAQVRGASEPRSGDIIVVPAAVEYKRFGSVFLPILQIVPGILSLIVTILVLTNQ
jgi:protein involved in polysaccharide export with SLBB domain